MVSQETRRKISESLKAYYAARGSARSKAKEAAATVRSGGRSAATAVENKVRSVGAKLTKSKVDDVTTAAGNVKRSVTTTAKNIADKASAKAGSVAAGVNAAKPAAKEAANSLKADAKTAVKKVLDKTTLDEKAVELYKKAKSKVTKKPTASAKGTVPKTYRT